MRKLKVDNANNHPVASCEAVDGRIMKLSERLGSRMTLEDKVGQLFLVGIRGTSISEESRAIVEDLRIGGVYLTNANMASPSRVASMTSDLQRTARRMDCAIPLLIACDHEGHWVVLSPYSCPGPGNLGLGAVRSPSATGRIYSIYASELRAVGINVDLAPVADVNSNPGNPIIGSRSFGQNPKAVGLRVRAAVRALQRGGIISAIKHFPGHGNTSTDSHSGLPRVSRPEKEIRKVDLPPFESGVAGGAELVMTSHIIFDALDPGVPATFSSAILGGILRDRMRFTGVVLTDSMNMGAIVKAYDPEESCVKALRAGADMILLAQEQYDAPMEDFQESYSRKIDAVIKAVDAGRLEAGLVDKSVRRILALKRKYDLFRRRPSTPSMAEVTVGSPRHRQTELEICRMAVAVLKNDGTMPLRLKESESVSLVNPVRPESYALLGRTRGIGPNLGPIIPFKLLSGEVRRRHANTLEFWINDHTPRIDEELAKLKELSDLIVVVTEKHNLPGFVFDDVGQAKVVRLACGIGRPVVVVGLRDPCEFARMGPVNSYICAFSARPPSIVGAVEVLFGERKSRGFSPVSLN